MFKLFFLSIKHFTFNMESHFSFPRKEKIVGHHKSESKIVTYVIEVTWEQYGVCKEMKYASATFQKQHGGTWNRKLFLKIAKGRFAKKPTTLTLKPLSDDVKKQLSMVDNQQHNIEKVRSNFTLFINRKFPNRDHSKADESFFLDDQNLFNVVNHSLVRDILRPEITRQVLKDVRKQNAASIVKKQQLSIGDYYMK